MLNNYETNEEIQSLEYDIRDLREDIEYFETLETIKDIEYSSFDVDLEFLNDYENIDDLIQVWKKEIKTHKEDIKNLSSVESILNKDITKNIVLDTNANDKKYLYMSKSKFKDYQEFLNNKNVLMMRLNLFKDIKDKHNLKIYKSYIYTITSLVLGGIKSYGRTKSKNIYRCRITSDFMREI